MANNQDYAKELGSAWALHRKGQNDEAIGEFNKLLQLSANNIDGMYGLGLAQRSAGSTEAARATFEKCIATIKTALAEHPGEDRYEMLSRMAKQRLDEVKAK